MNSQLVEPPRVISATDRFLGGEYVFNSIDSINRMVERLCKPIRSEDIKQKIIEMGEILKIRFNIEESNQKGKIPPDLYELYTQGKIPEPVMNLFLKGDIAASYIISIWERCGELTTMNVLDPLEES